jgi:hypothetical protein
MCQKQCKSLIVASSSRLPRKFLNIEALELCYSSWPCSSFRPLVVDGGNGIHCFRRWELRRSKSVTHRVFQLSVGEKLESFSFLIYAS